ncbi:SseB family protein [Leifsonia poae]|uniref:SseB family protein n=1 Tax=Leifsonia poae TaxID=110933 RepID=UPI001CBAFBC2|nr:SseB family protein [Leifsonia poae]
MGGFVGLFSRGKKDVPPRDASAANVIGAGAESRPVSNQLVLAALRTWGAERNAQTFANVLRQCATGELLLDTTGSTVADQQNGFQTGDTLGVGYRTDEQGRTLLLAFTNNERLAEYHRGEPVLSLAQPAAAVMTQAATSPYDGIAIDAGSSDLCIAYGDEIRRHLTDDASLNSALKSALVSRSLPWTEFLDLVGGAPAVFIATQEATDASGAVTGITVPTVSGKNGETYAAVFTSPAEVWAWAPPFDAHATGMANVARAALEDGHDGLVLNPAGQSVVIAPDELPPLAAS